MTVQYLGMDEYRIYLESKAIVLSAKDILEVQMHDFNIAEDDTDVPTRRKLLESNERHQEYIESLEEIVRELNEDKRILENMLL